MKLLRVDPNNIDGSGRETHPLHNGEVEIACASLVFSYLTQHCYAESAAAFLRYTNNGGGTTTGTMEESMALRTLEYRRHLGALVVDGKIDEALAYIEEYFPAILSPAHSDLTASTIDNMSDAPPVSADEWESGVWLRFRLHTQQFIEMVRQGRAAEALDFTEAILSPMAEGRPRLSAYLQEVVVLLAYGHPENSPVSHLLSLQYRTELASLLNSAILSKISLC